MKVKVFLYLGLLATTAVWGGAFLVMKDSLVRQDVYSFLASRFILAAAFMFFYKPKSLTGLDRKFVKRAVLIGLLLCSGFIFQTFGLTQTTVSNTGFITGLYLVFTPLISWILLKREIFKVQWLAVLVATIGLYFISFNGISFGIGEILVLISALLFAGQIVALGEWSDGENTYALTLIQILVSAVIFFALSLKDGFQLPPDNGVWSAVFYTAFFATFLGFLIQVKAQSIMSATVAGVLLAMETPFALFFGLYFDNDPLTLRIISGGTLVLIAMALVIWSDSKHTNSGVNNSGK
ncbi:EamA-like transporter family protein [Candidatus Nanopelagicus limnes]|jgi:drug/metabolite transporter (DMT)-like permease|uniref:EamA-like transporter family protein n=1 Tax=Candidatus Nanopelagicus limnae TaxID=1884634 RepID=A0A249JYA4_9ACTN|nr:DMT family transporter [Candidatus Nanopelagicus limnes]ASY09492.1 EamA-like transporter family protein [Candidatus Nanopelagicus limnes]